MVSSSGSKSPRPAQPPAVGCFWERDVAWPAAPRGPLPATAPGSPRAESAAPGWVLTERPSGKEMSLPKPVLPCALPGPRGRVRASRPDHIRGNVKALGLPAAPRGRPRSPGIPGVAGAPGTTRITREPASGPGGGDGPRGSSQGWSPSPSAGQTTDLLGRSRRDLPGLAGVAGWEPEVGAAILEIILEAAGSARARDLSAVPQLP